MDQDCIKYAAWMMACDAKEAAGVSDLLASLSPLKGGLVGAGVGAAGGGLYSLLHKPEPGDNDKVKRFFRNMLTGGVLGGGVGAGVGALPGLIGGMKQELAPPQTAIPNKPTSTPLTTELRNTAVQSAAGGAGGFLTGRRYDLQENVNKVLGEIPTMREQKLDSLAETLRQSEHPEFKGEYDDLVNKRRGVAQQAEQAYNNDIKRINDRLIELERPAPRAPGAAAFPDAMPEAPEATRLLDGQREQLNAEREAAKRLRDAAVPEFESQHSQKLMTRLRNSLSPEAGIKRINPMRIRRANTLGAALEGLLDEKRVSRRGANVGGGLGIGLPIAYELYNLLKGKE
jgi:hypothetical protein